jgi:hypothetical protein
MNYYRITFTNYGEVFEYGDTATHAISTAQTHLREYMTRVNLTPIQLGTAAVRRAVYGEWDCGSECFTLDGSHTHAKREVHQC